MQDPLLVSRLSQIFDSKGLVYETLRMFGGTCIMLNDKLCVGTFKEGLLCRIDPDQKDELLAQPYADLMVMGNKTMHGFIIVNELGVESDDALLFWVEKCIAYNPKAKISKKRKNKK